MDRLEHHLREARGRVSWAINAYFRELEGKGNYWVVFLTAPSPQLIHSCCDEWIDVSPACTVVVNGPAKRESRPLSAFRNEFEPVPLAFAPSNDGKGFKGGTHIIARMGLHWVCSHFQCVCGFVCLSFISSYGKYRTSCNLTNKFPIITNYNSTSYFTCNRSASSRSSTCSTICSCFILLIFIIIIRFHHHEDCYSTIATTGSSCVITITTINSTNTIDVITIRYTTIGL
jgi:hypothetical protein